ncbi:MAG: hypothetical protein HDR55_04950 [Treponema sp.]|nr:hypothetical protein [Treponema sp.]
MERKLIEKFISEFETKADNAYDTYQETGSPSYEKTYSKYSALAEALHIALENDVDKNCNRDRRKNNIVAYAERLSDKIYSKDEVVEILHKMAYW